MSLKMINPKKCYFLYEKVPFYCGIRKRNPHYSYSIKSHEGEISNVGILNVHTACLLKNSRLAIVSLD